MAYGLLSNSACGTLGEAPVEVRAVRQNDCFLVYWLLVGLYPSYWGGHRASRVMCLCLELR